MTLTLKDRFGKAIIFVAHYLPQSLYYGLWRLSKILGIRQRKLLFVLEPYSRMDTHLLSTVIRNNGITLYTLLQQREPDDSRIEFYRQQLYLLVEEMNRRTLPFDPSLSWALNLVSHSTGSIRQMAVTEVEALPHPETMLECIKRRRSVRSFLFTPVPLESIEKILEAGRWAPSSSNRQVWKFVVENNSSRQSVVEKNAAAKSRAPVKIYVLMDERYYSETSACALDAGAILQNMLLMATALGLGSCWVYQGDSVNQKKLIREFGVEPYYFVYSAIHLGFTAEVFPAPPKKPVRENTLYRGFEVTP